MGAQATRLTDTKIRNVRPGAKEIVLSDGQGLQLRVRPNNTRTWSFNYVHPLTKKRKGISLGVYGPVSLSDARKQATEYREMVAKGVDPMEHRKALSRHSRTEAESLFENVASAWFEIKKDSVKPDYAEDVWRSLDLHVFPKLGKVPISKVTAPDVISILRPVEQKGSLETVKRVSQRLNEIMAYAVNSGLIFSNPLTNIYKIFKKPRKKSMATLPPDELPELMVTLANASIKRTTRCLIEWQLHTMTRPVEAATTRWNDIDMDRRIWSIPAERMKKGKPHFIPLSDQALALLALMRPYSGHLDYVFPADRNPRTHTNSQTANMALKRMGFEGRLVSHGLRSIASTILNEEAWDRELIEVALAHADKDEVRSAYNRANYLERRKPMMEWWSKHIEQASMGNLSVTAAGNASLQASLPRTSSM
tara:strand:- start:33300 stop:34565 length:1266 start_codon:yes stop_codon:yes gene_type:complete